MSLRKLSACEVTSVSGGVDLNGGLELFRDMARYYSDSYPGKDWHYIVAVEPGINSTLASFLDGFGVDGKASLENWATQYDC